MNELMMTKKRLLDLEESKNALTNQVKTLRDQLSKFENNNNSNLNSNNNHHACKCHTNEYLNDFKEFNNKAQQVQHLQPQHQHNKQQQQQLQEQQQVNDLMSTGEVVRTIEKYERQKDYLQEHNQSLKLLLKEKEMRETQLIQENRNMKESRDQLERENVKLKMDIEQVEFKLSESQSDADKYCTYVRKLEEQLSLSEKKREELKQDAQETIKLWKNKVKKLEKTLEYYKNESTRLSEQNELLKANQNTCDNELNGLRVNKYYFRLLST
jgi:chromosome segregation ATPase